MADNSPGVVDLDDELVERDLTLPDIIAAVGKIDVGTVTTGAPGSPVVVTATPENPGILLNFTIPQGETGDVTPEVIAARDAAVGAAQSSASSAIAADVSADAASADAVNAHADSLAAAASKVDAQAAAEAAEAVATNGAQYASYLGLDPHNTLLVFMGDSTMFLLSQTGGLNTSLTQLSAAGGPAEGLYGWVNMGSSGYELTQCVNAPLNPSWGGPITGNADWNFAGVKQNAAASVATPMRNLIAWLATVDAKIKVVILFGMGFNDPGKNVSIGQLSQADFETYNIALHRTFIETVHIARPTALIVPVIQHRILARPYAGTVPVTAVWNAPGAPGFGIDLTADTVLLTKWNAGLANAKTQVAGEYGYTALWDWRKEAAGYPKVDVETPTTWPYYADNGHEAAPAANGLGGSVVRLFFGNRFTPSSARMRLADQMSIANGTFPEEQYGRYCEGHPERYTPVFEGVCSAAGTNFIDVAILTATAAGRAAALFLSGTKSKSPIYIQVGNDICFRIASNYVASDTSATTSRITNITINAAIASAINNSILPLKVYVDRETTTGDSYIDGLIVNRTSYRKSYTAIVSAAGNGFIDVTFDGISKSGDALFRIILVRALSGLKLAVGGSVSAIQDLSTGWTIGNWTPTSRVFRLLNTGDKTSWQGLKAALLIDQAVSDPSTQDQVEFMGVSAPLSTFVATGVVRRYYPGLTKFTANTGVAVPSTVDFTVSKVTSNAKTALANGTVAANGYSTTVTFTAWDAKPGDIVVVDVTQIGGAAPVYSGSAVVSGLLS